RKRSKNVTRRTAAHKVIPSYELRYFYVDNFKPFSLEKIPKSQENIKLPEYKPLTLIVGPNSAGKSALIQSLMLFSQSFKGRSGLRILNSRAPEVDLGKYESFINTHDTKKKLTSLITIHENFHNDKKENIIHNYHSKYFMNDEGRANLEGVMYYSFLEKDSNNGSYSTNKDKIMNFTSETKPDDIVSTFKLKDNLPKDLLYNLKNSTIDRDGKIKVQLSEKEIIKFVKHMRFVDVNYSGVPEMTDKGAVLGMNKKEIEVLMGMIKKNPRDFFHLYDVVDQYLKNSSKSIKRLFNKIRYIGPYRDKPKRSQRNIGEFVNVGPSGENTPNILFHKRDHIIDINSALKTLGVEYEIDIEKFGDPSIDEMFSLTLRDKRIKFNNKKDKISSVDVGFGIFQFLPIILQGISEQKSIIPCEQPEIHLHPKLVANLADFFIETSNLEIDKKHRLFKINSQHLNKNRYIFGNQWIIETHSELLIRRICRRIREGKINNNDVSVLYVNPPTKEINTTTVKRLHINEKGRFIDRWPEGFFAEALDEL
ncbi:DUF3696 domain-containing protein, partial [Pelagibacteraceae bacterium]|nr:DUF3696 domain-containing protein [Pelagibacteraceae bacterium]